MNLYIPTLTYRRLVETLATLPLCPITGEGVDRDQVKLTLGEIGGMWPACILCDPARENEAEPAVVTRL